MDSLNFKYTCHIECPKCGSIDINADTFEVEYFEAWRRVECQECWYQWDEIFQFRYNEEVE